MLAVLLCLFLAATAFAGPGVDFRFSEEELERYFGVKSHEKAPAYEIVYPEYVIAESKRSIGRSAIAASYLDIQVDAFGQAFHMTLEHDDSNIEHGLEAEYVTDEGTIKVPVRTDCLYTGKVVGESDSLVSVATCAGLMAVINHAGGPTYIEPLDDEHALKRDIGRGLPHVAYKNRVYEGPICPVTEDSIYAKFQQVETVGDQTEDISPQATKYLELAFIGDSVLYDLRGGSTHDCMAILFNAVKNVLQLGSLDGTNLVPKLVHVKVFTSAESGLQTCPDARQSLDRASDWQNSNNFPSSDCRHWDNAAILTGWEMNGGGTLGIAWLSNCGNRYAASVSTFRGLQATNVVAHEIGHNLSMYHDGTSGNSCPSSGYVMAAYVNDHRADPNWSTCSKSYYSSFVSSRSCYNDS